MRILLGRLLPGVAIGLAMMTTTVSAEDIVLRGMGSFHIGGRIVEVSGKPVRMITRQPGGPLTKLDPNGSTWSSRCTCNIFCRKIEKENCRC